MKVKHSIETEDVECNALFDMLKDICLATYSSSEEQISAIEKARPIFKAKLDDFVASAFKVGQKVGKYKADVKDTAMYDASATPPVL